MGSRVSVDGEVTIPEELREQLGIRPGDEMEWEATPDGRLVCSNASSLRALLEEWRGKWDPGDRTVDEWIEEMRGR